MDVMIKYFDELNDLGAQLVQHVGGGEESTKAVNSQLQNCQDRWDNLVQRMEHCTKQVLLLLFFLSLVKRGWEKIKKSRKKFEVEN